MIQKLNMDKKNIKDDKIRKMFREQGFGDMLLDDETLLKSRQKLCSFTIFEIDMD